MLSDERVQELKDLVEELIDLQVEHNVIFMDINLCDLDAEAERIGQECDPEMIVSHYDRLRAEPEEMRFAYDDNRIL